MSNYFTIDNAMEKFLSLRNEGLNSVEIAEVLFREGYRTTRGKEYTQRMLNVIWCRYQQGAKSRYSVGLNRAAYKLESNK